MTTHEFIHWANIIMKSNNKNNNINCTVITVLKSNHCEVLKIILIIIELIAI